MKSLAAHHFRSARAALPAAHAYRQGIDDALAVLGLHQQTLPGDAPAILLIAADLGLCGGYNSQLATAALDHHGRLNAQRVYCVGHRPLSYFKRAAVKVDREYSAPTGVTGLTELLLRLGEDLLVDYLDGKFGTLNVISAQFDGVGEFTPICTRVLPIDQPGSVSSMKPSTYVSSDHLTAVAVREYIYIRLFQTSLDSLASEHGARLVATESAGEWLTEKSSAARRQLASIRREAATQEVLDIAVTARRRKSSSV
jgi:F-type H+-transporting ATPase subunit gamma